MDRFTDEALVLSTLDYGESDRIVTLFTRERGRLSAFAAGARKSKRRFAGALEPFTLLKVQLVSRRGSTVRLDSADIVRPFHPIRDDLARIARALYCVELVRELTRDEQPHPELLDAALEYLAALEQGAAGPTSLLAFELDALAHTGLMPRFDACALCGGPTGSQPAFDPEHGGAICGMCRPRAVYAVALDSRVVEGLAAIQRGIRQPLPPEVRAKSREVLNQFISHHLGRRLKSVEFMVQVGVD